MTAAGSGWKLRVLDGGTGQPREFDLKVGLEMGRHPQNTCVLQDENVGRFQLRVVEEHGALCFEECGSSNASRIDGRALAKGERVRVAPNQRVSIGRSTIEVVAPVAELGTIGSPRGLDQTIAAGARPDVTRGPAAPLAQGTVEARTSPPDMDRTLSAGERTPPAAADRTLQAASPKPAPPPAAAPETADVPRRAAQPAVTPVPVNLSGSVAPAVPARMPAANEDMNVGVGGGTLKLEAGNGAGSAADKAFLSTRKARLVLAGEVDRRTVAIESTEFNIGRDTGDCRLAHPAVSSRHARLRANPALGTFQVEDLGSGNHTYLNGAALAPKSPQPLSTESHLRFGVIDALFVVDLDGESQRIPPAVYERAVELLVAQGAVPAAQAAEARKQAAANHQHPGEVLILSNAVKVGAWRSAFESARLTHLAGSGARGKDRRWLWVGIGVAALAAIAWFLLRK